MMFRPSKLADIAGVDRAAGNAGPAFAGAGYDPEVRSSVRRRPSCFENRSQRFAAFSNVLFAAESGGFPTATVRASVHREKIGRRAAAIDAVARRRLEVKDAAGKETSRGKGAVDQTTGASDWFACLKRYCPTGGHPRVTATSKYDHALSFFDGLHFTLSGRVFGERYP